MKKQNGIVLVIILILLIPLAISSLSVMQWCRDSIKINSANRQNVNAMILIHNKQVDISAEFNRNKFYELFMKHSELIQAGSCQRFYHATSLNIDAGCIQTQQLSTQSYGMTNNANLNAKITLMQPLLLNHQYVD